jgi:SAM-dependent methyltransferase
MIKSPITDGTTKLIKTIPVEPIIKYYKGHDVRPLFQGRTEIEQYECQDTGYQFFYPYFVAGDDAFYQYLSNENLYYQAWKWEHSIADKYINDGDKVLELGCANGDFLVELKKKKNIQAFGTEMNTEAIAKAKASGVSFEEIKDTDMVCAFQVLEHIADVKSFIQFALDSVKSGGYVVFGVPNNTSFIKDDNYAFLNIPPHHMGVWTPHALEKLSDFFPMEFLGVNEEKVQPYHYRYYYQVKFGDKLKPLGFFGKVINKLVFEIFIKHFIGNSVKDVIGHTMVGVYRKK